VDYANNFFLGVSASFVEIFHMITEEQKISVAGSYWRQDREEFSKRSVFPLLLRVL
jgi:hypothetical protein